MFSHLLTISDLTPEQIQSILDLSIELNKKPSTLLQGKNIAFLFEKPSLRTKIGTEVAINHLGGSVVELEADLIFSNSKAVPFSCRESLKDAMMNVSQWCDAIFARVYSHSTLQKMKELGTIPIVNALCDQHHPMQALADLLTLQQNLGKDHKASIAYVGDANNVAFSLTEVALLFGYNVTFSGPEPYTWSSEQLQYFALLSVEYGGSFRVVETPSEAVMHADAVYTDTFISMGQEHLFEEKIKHFEPYQVNEKLFANAGEHTGFMHCLPAHRGVEVTDGVIDHPNSWVYQQAKNRMIVSKGVFAALFIPELLYGKPSKNGVAPHLSISS